MDHVSKLTDEELRVICSLIPIRHFRECFKGNPQKYHKLYSRCRAEKISLEDVEKIALKYRNDPFISDTLNVYIQTLLDVVKDLTATFTDAGTDSHTALLRVLPKSDFRNHIDLYLKLSQDSYTSEYGELLQSALKELDTTEKLTQEQPASPQIEALQNQLSDAEKALETERENHLHEIDTLNASKADFQAELETARLSVEKKDQELEKLHLLIERSDFPADLQADDAYPYVSLCRVGGPNGTSIELIRLADIVDGMIQSQRQDNTPNRSILFTKKCYKSMGFVGIWKWRTEPNFNPAKMDYIVSNFQAEQMPVEVLIIPDCGTIDYLRECLLCGVQNIPQGERVLFSIDADGKYQGLLCSTQELTSSNGKTAIKPNVVSLPLYEFTEQDIVKIERSHFHQRINLGVPKTLVPIMDPLDAVKQAILKRAPWSKLKTWFTKKDAQRFWELLKNLPVDEFYEEVALTCGCSVDEAKTYADRFIQRAGTYLQQEDIESEALLLALENSPTLLEKCQSLIEEDWRAAHAKQLEEAEAELSHTVKAAQKQKNIHSQLLNQQKQIQSHLDELTAEISKKEKLASDVEEMVAQRIDAAKKNAADFICEMAFAQPGITTPTSAVSAAAQNVFQPGAALNAELLEVHETWDDFLHTLGYELEEAGVSENYSHWFAAFLYAAYIAHVPLLLAGPNGHDIADAFSASMFGQTASVIRCENMFSPSVIEECRKGGGQIVAVIDPLNSGWISHVSELTAMQDKFLIATHPFAEDLLIEPRGLYNYMLPVLTELFVNGSAARKFNGGRFDEKFQGQAQVDPTGKLPMAKAISISPMVSGRLRKITANMKVLLGTDPSDSCVLFGLFPYAYAIGNARSFWEQAQDTLPKDTKNLLRTFLGEAE